MLASVIQTTESKKSLGILEWLEFLSGEPSAFIEELLARKEYGDAQATYAVHMLQTVELSVIIDMLQPYKNNDEYKYAIEQLEQHTDWLQSAVEYLRSKMSGTT